MRAAASGYLLKDTPAQELVATVRVIAAGDALLSPSITKRLIEQFGAQPERRRLAQSRVGDRVRADRELSNSQSVAHVLMVLVASVSERTAAQRLRAGGIGVRSTACQGR